MRLSQFEVMVRRMADEIPRGYMDGVAAIEVSPRAVPDPVSAGVYTLGECIPVHSDDRDVVSRIVLYHGSFEALAAGRDDFDWRVEAWDTLTHELRHHLEWRADTDRLGEYDWSADQNFRRHEDKAFDPLFYRSGEEVARSVYRVEGDVFLERLVSRVPDVVEVEWHGGRYSVAVPKATPPLYLVLDGLHPAPSGDVVLVLLRRARVWDVFRRSRAATELRVDAR
jgi:hypothetical protein